MSADQLLQQLAACAPKVPASINSASVQKVREYKRWVGHANKAVNSRTQNEQVLRSLINQYESYK